MPENKEELLGILYEFDDRVRMMNSILMIYDKHDLTDVEKYGLLKYRTLLESLERVYDAIDRFGS